MSEHRARKRFGQNFLHDPGVIMRIVHAINPKAGESLVEIGPGQGALTWPLLEELGQLHAVELDRNLIAMLSEQASQYGELVLHNADALKFDFSALSSGNPLRIVGNLPYNISTPLLFHLLGQAECIGDMHFMLQKEVVERMAASPGDSNYGRLSIMLQYHCQVVPLFKVGAGAFKPQPKVESAIVRLIPHPSPPVQVDNLEIFGQLVKVAFSHRRKTLRKAIRNLASKDAIEAAGIDSGLRPERLSIEDFANLANTIQRSNRL